MDAANLPLPAGDEPAPRVSFAGRDIVCFANDWSGDPLSKKHVMTRLARKQPRPVGQLARQSRATRLRCGISGASSTSWPASPASWAEAPSRLQPNIHVLTPLAVPSYRSPWARRFNELAVTTTVSAPCARSASSVRCSTPSCPPSAWVAGKLGETHVVYHCVDEYAQFDGAGDPIAELEAELIDKSDLVITCSAPLQESKSQLHPTRVLVRHGVEQSHFAQALDEATEIPADVRQLPRPIFGFYGLVAEWVDLEALARVAERVCRTAPGHRRRAQPGQRRRSGALRALPNVHFLGRKPYAALPGYCKAFDVALLPFVKNELTENANPLKLREYLAAGLPVVSTDIPEAKAVAERGVYLADGADAFVTRVGEALLGGAGPNRARSDAMARESWDDKVADIETLLMELKP